MLQGIGTGSVRGPWQRVFEESYQAIARALPSISMDTPTGYQAFHIFELLRFARLCAYLKTREPDERVTPNVLVYELDEKSLAEAISGPPRGMVDKTWIIGAPPD